jgi:hypothetical protein
MADATVSLHEVYTPSKGPYFDVEVDDPVATPTPVGTLVNLSSGKAIPAAADSIQVAVVRRLYTDPVTALPMASLDGGGAIVEVEHDGSVDEPSMQNVAIVDNQSVAVEADPTKMAGTVTKLISATRAQVCLRRFSNAPYAD